MNAGRRVALIVLLTAARGGLAIDPAEVMAESRAAVGRDVAGFSFVTSDGHAVSIEAFRGKPTLVSLIFTSCRHICPTQTNSLARASDAAQDVLGRDRFNVVTVGFDTANDTPERMAAYARTRGVDDRGWAFLSADRATIASFTERLGFKFEPADGGFDHVTQTTLIDADGRIAEQIYGASFDPPAIVEPLQRVLSGTRSGFDLGSWIDEVRLLCTVYDPRSGRYRYDYSVLVAAITGLMSLSLVGAFVFRLWRTG